MPERSGFAYPNRLARAFFLTLEDVLGKNGLDALAALANLTAYSQQLPADDLAREFDFAAFAALCEALEEVYGARGGRGLALRIGREWFGSGLRDFGILAGLAHPDFRALPLSRRADISLIALAKTLTTTSDQRCTLAQQNATYSWVMLNSAMAWGRVSDKPVCHVFVGMLQGCLHYASGGYEFHVYEQTCSAVNSSDRCVFMINKKPIGQLVGG